MKKITSIQGTLYYVILIMLLSLEASSQSTSALTLNGHLVRSSINHKTYELYVSLPKNYSASDTTRYPVLYVLDGKYSYPLVSSIREVMDMAREIKDVIIVAIGDSSQSESDWLISRYLDYTPSNSPQMDSLWPNILKLPRGSMKSGGARAFVDVIRKDIIPFIDKHYKTNSDRGISGHSLGGLFAAYCLLSAPDLFNRFGINSPSLWWNNSEMLTLEDSFAKANKNINVKAFISVGSLEGDMMIGPVNKFIDQLRTMNSPGLAVTSQVFDSETHVSVGPASSSRMLKVLYKAGF